MDNFNGLATTFKKNTEVDSSIFYANKVLDASKQTHYPVAKLTALNLLADIYQAKGKVDSVAKYLQLTVATKDSLFSQQKALQIQSMTFAEEQRSQEQIQEQQQYRNRLILYGLIGALIIFLVVSVILYRNNQHKQEAYALLQMQKTETDIQKLKVEETLANLRSTQAQLIQSEKMASLGELTAGIAHEIQNPLNFVNNLSEVNKELLTEMSNEISKGNYRDVKALARDVINNEEKVSEHGKRADAIVKGMLQHSRTRSGGKEPADINVLVDEYLRLAYHGLRAKDKSFDAKTETNFDNTIEKIDLVPQDIGRVVLNLINNAFYAVNEKRKTAGGDYQPTVNVQTKKLSGKIEIRVRDNGSGIPEKVGDKIFQPFFTTKPTGQGTGLGLSLAYDIVKAHGGEIKVQSKEGEGSEFIVQLPKG